MYHRYKKNLHGAILGAVLVPLGVFVIQFVTYTLLPFDWFVDIQKYHALDMTPTSTHQIVMMRNARFDIKGAATKEVYRISTSSEDQTIHTNYKESFIYEKSSNGKEFILNVLYTDLPIEKAMYKTIDYVEIYPMKGVQKRKVIETNIWEVK